MFKSAFIAAMALGAAATSNTTNCTERTLDLEPHYTNGSISVEHLSTTCNLDGFKMLTPAARSSADFWYFDVFSEKSNQTLNIVFFNSGDFANYPHPLAVQVSGVYPNGTDFYFEALANEGVHLSNGPAGISGDWKGTGGFNGTSLDEPDVEYWIIIDSDEMDIHGSINFKSIAPAHYPCTLNGTVGIPQTLLPGLYWANAVPDARTTVDLHIGDVAMAFADGVGYHDKNWGNQSIIDGPRYWDWGHGRLGPYSIVWYNLLDYHGEEHRRAYVVEDGKVLLVSCARDAMQVRQKGGRAAWPPVTGLYGTEGLDINFTLADGRALNVEMTTEFIVRDEKGAYQRANGHLRGGVVGGEVYEGRAHLEEFIFGIVNEYTPVV